jgi:hypothetical protein
VFWQKNLRNWFLVCVALWPIQQRVNELRNTFVSSEQEWNVDPNKTFNKPCFFGPFTTDIFDVVAFPTACRGCCLSSQRVFIESTCFSWRNCTCRCQWWNILRRGGDHWLGRAGAKGKQSQHIWRLKVKEETIYPMVTQPIHKAGNSCQEWFNRPRHAAFHGLPEVGACTPRHGNFFWV